VITKFKIFEGSWSKRTTHGRRIKKFPKIDDYVICCSFSERNTEINNFIDNNVGKCIDTVYYDMSKQTHIDGRTILSQSITGYRRKVEPGVYIVEYENIPENIKNCFIVEDRIANKIYKNCKAMFITEVFEFSKDKEELEIIIASDKYNL
jgi:hypothetical protein